MDHTVIRLDLPAEHKHLNVIGACLNAILERVDQISDKETKEYDDECNSTWGKHAVLLLVLEIVHFHEQWMPHQLGTAIGLKSLSMEPLKYEN